MTALIRAYDIRETGAATPLTAADLSAPPPDGTWRWVHLLRTGEGVKPPMAQREPCSIVSHNSSSRIR